MIGDMMPHNALDHITKNTLMIVPGNREGLVLTALCENLLTQGPHLVSGIVFTKWHSSISKNSRSIIHIEDSIIYG